MLISEIFKSIQGEGDKQGYLTVFIRLSGCNLKCSYCDTKYAQKADPESEMSIGEIIERVYEIDRNTRNVCITGGEPLLQQEEVIDLVDQLIERYDCNISIETNGTIKVSDSLTTNPNVVVVADFKFGHKFNNWELEYPHIVKFVISNRAQYIRCIRLSERLKCMVHLSPLFTPKLIRALPQWIVKDKCKHKLSLQLHKFLSCK